MHTAQLYNIICKTIPVANGNTPLKKISLKIHHISNQCIAKLSRHIVDASCSSRCIKNTKYTCTTVSTSLFGFRTFVLFNDLFWGKGVTESIRFGRRKPLYNFIISIFFKIFNKDLNIAKSYILNLILY